MKFIKNLYSILPSTIKKNYRKLKYSLKNYFLAKSVNKKIKKLNLTWKAIPTSTYELKLKINKNKIIYTDEPFALLGYIQQHVPKKGDIIIDGGAYEGIFAITISDLIGKKGKILCFEPDKKNNEKLKKELKKYKIKNVKIIKKGLWNKDTILKFESCGPGSSIKNRFNKGEIIKIKVCSLDNELKRLKIKKVDLIKMDIEGAEVEAIEGCKNTIKNNKNINLAIASYHLINGKETYLDCEKIMKKYNLKTFTSNNKHKTTYGSKSL